MTSVPRAAPNSLRAEMLVFLCVVIWAANYPLAKYGIEGMDIFIFNGVRYVVAALVLVQVSAVRSRWTPVARSDWKKLLWAGTVANIIYQVAFIIGLSMTTAGNSAILLATSPLWTVFLSSRAHKERVAHEVWTGMAISLGGIVMIIFGGGGTFDVSRSAMIGDLICLGAAFLWGSSTVLQKPLLVRYSPRQVSLVMVSVGAVGLSVIAAPAAVSVSWKDVHWTYYAAAVASGALSNGIANVFWSYGVQRLGPTRTGNFGNLIPAIALGVSYVTLGETLTVLQIAGAAITLGGIWYARR